MPQKVKGSVADMRGHEVKNLVVTDDGCLALSDDLQPSLLPPVIFTVPPEMLMVL